MQRFFHSLVADSVRSTHGIYWCSALFAVQAMLALAAGVLESGFFAPVLMLGYGALSAYVSLALLQAVKAAWHWATFILFLSIIVSAVAVACAPGEMADGEQHFLETVLDVVMLALFILAYSFLRRPAIREIYGVPLSYREGSDE